MLLPLLIGLYRVHKNVAGPGYISYGDAKVDQNMFVELEVPRPRLATSHLGNETKGKDFRSM